MSLIPSRAFWYRKKKCSLSQREPQALFNWIFSGLLCSFLLMLTHKFSRFPSFLGWNYHHVPQRTKKAAVLHRDKGIFQLCGLKGLSFVVWPEPRDTQKLPYPSPTWNSCPYMMPSGREATMVLQCFRCKFTKWAFWRLMLPRHF